MEKISLSVSLIRNTSSESVRWLARVNEGTSELDFVIAQRLGNESFRESAIREVAWELRLDRECDFLVSSESQLNLEFVDRLPRWFEKHHVLASFFNVSIYSDEALNSLKHDPRNVWVRSDEIRNGATDCGRRLHPIVPYLINRSNVIRPGESSQSIDPRRE